MNLTRKFSQRKQKIIFSFAYSCITIIVKSFVVEFNYFHDFDDTTNTLRELINVRSSRYV